MAADAGPTRSDVEAALGGLDRVALAEARWYGQKGVDIESIGLDEAFVLDAAGPHVLAIATFHGGRSTARYLLALTGAPLRPAVPGDGTWQALATAMAEGRTIAALPTLVVRAADLGLASQVSAALVCRPGRAMPPGVAALAERDLGADQSNTSVVLGEDVLLKAYRRVQPGLNPELELVAYLSEEAGFAAVPPLAGFVEMVSTADEATTLAIAQAFVADGADAYEMIVESLTGWLLAPGAVSVEFASEVATDLGELTAGLHAALASARDVPGFEPHEATRAELRSWAAEARAQFERALEVTTGEAHDLLRSLAPRIVAELTVIEALPAAPLVTRVHGDYHLGQVLMAPDGYRVIDFEGEPFRPLEARRAQQSPLRDIATMLRSFDHVGRAAERHAVARNDGPLESPGLDIDGWLARARERFLAAYHAGLREAGAPIVVDPALIRAFEVEKECYEFEYASTYLPSWLWAAEAGLRDLFPDGSG